MKCLQAVLKGNAENANRDLVFEAEFHKRNSNQKKELKINVKSFAHRTWTHFCWSFSGITGISKLYHNGILLHRERINMDDVDIIISDANKMSDAAFIFGQESDSMRGGFDNQQAFLGELSELNLWNYTMQDRDILAMALCRDGKKGNVIAWEQTNFIFNNVMVTDLHSLAPFCFKQSQYVIFTEKATYTDAKEICEIHGGSLSIPRSEGENQEILDVVLRHKQKCMGKLDISNQNAVWIGARMINFKWYEDKSTSSAVHSLNYTNFSSSPSSGDLDCAYMRGDGSWLQGSDCAWISLCPVCFIENEPVFTMKGSCNIGDIDWNYYLSVHTKNEIKLYEGYMKNNIIFDESNQSWNISTKAGDPQNFIAGFPVPEFETKYPIGRKKWFMDYPLCGVKDPFYPLTISICNLQTQFTCNSGACIDINKRCNERKDCIDGSDEKMCTLINIPSSYIKANAPDTPIDNLPLALAMQTTILNIDSIDTVNMIVTLTMEIKIQWYDKRLTFSNPIVNKDNIIPPEMAEKVWSPLRDLIHENAIIGEVTYEGDHKIRLLPNISENIEASAAIENRLFNGSFNLLELSQRVRIKYNCIFDVKRFPFDGQNCFFIMRLDQRKGGVISFVDDGAILYNGLSTVGQFSIGHIYSKIKNTNQFTKYTIVIPMNRIFSNQITITFVPTILLWLFGYSTLFIDTEDLTDRFMGAGTALLVIATLLNAINSDLPKTSYMKFIDLWFSWHVASIFAITIYHVILDRLRKYFEIPAVDEVMPFKTTDYIKWSAKKCKKKITAVNNSFITIFPMLNCLFYGVYFYVTLN